MTKLKIPQRNLIGCAGAGGTGKTSVLQGVVEKFTAEGIPTITFMSPARAFFAQNGIADEKSLLAMPENAIRQFQMELLDVFLNATAKMTRENHDKMVIADRTAFDHLAYIIYYSPNTLTLAHYSELLRKVRIYSEMLGAIVHFPYPAAFSRDVDPDNFRWAPPGKNIAVACLIGQHAIDHRLNMSPLHIELDQNGSTKERVDTIYDLFFSHYDLHG